VLKPDDVDDDDGEGVLLIFSTANNPEYLCTHTTIKYREDPNTNIYGHEMTNPGFV